MTYDNVALYLTNPTFIVLALMSVYSVTVMINQAYYLFSSREKGPELVQFLENARNGYTEIMAFLKAKDTPHRRLVQAWLKHSQQSAEALGALLSEEAKGLRWEAEHRLAALGTIANIAPFVGLFGTVVGVIRAFQAIALKASAGPSVVASGIAEALISTAAGLFVAVPAVVAYNYFLKRARKLSLELDHIATVLIYRGGK
ncbi:MAG: MotA/TolQ/ExbB proton channel family protein [Proteobacteria bacterium]|jgi:biopolymer transport protein ExbB/TolQ|nr:MotA/TolQ/ExbB proton channel family protein [Pseudomonadota bacterium]